MNKYTYIAIAGFALWLGSTAFFGWNDEPINAAERVFDIASTILIFWGVIGDILKGVVITKGITLKVEK